VKIGRLIFLRNKVRNLLILTQVVNAVIALFTGKLIAIYIDPQEFGVYGIHWATFIFFSTTLITPIIQFTKATEKTLHKKIGTVYYLVVAIGHVLIAYILLIVSLYFLNYNLDLILVIILFFFVPSYTVVTVIANFLNIHNQLIDYCKQSLIRSSGGLVFLITYFVIFQISSIENEKVLWLVQLIGAVLGVIIFLRKYNFYTYKAKIGINSFFNKYIKFAWPLMFMAIWAWVNNYFDRYAIEHYLSLDDVGVYNANYSVGSKFFLMISPIFMVLATPSVFDNLKKHEKKQRILKYSLNYFLLAIPILITIFLLQDIIGYTLLSPKYEDGFHIIFLIAVAFFIFTWTQLLELYFYSERTTKIIMIGNILSALTNISLNVLLIPKYGLNGAAYSTCIGFIIYLFVVYYKLRRQ